MTRSFPVTRFATLIFGFLAWATPALAAPVPAGAANDLSEQVRQAIARNYPGARVVLTSALHWSEGAPAEDSAAAPVRLLNETPRAEAVFAAGEARGWATFAAYVPAWVAVRRVLPGERLSPDQFVKQEVDVAQGMAREYRGVILPPSGKLEGLESRQTILEGQFALSSGVQRVPDLRRGEAVRVNLVSGEVVLSTSGVAQEPAYVDGSVRIVASKSKKEMTGTLRENGVVEVKL
jgi:flagella basal body P-ring formation protein FlgA